MRLGRLYLVVLACGLGFAARAEDVSIDALGGVISNNASAFYMISSANGAGQNVGLQGGVDKVTISGLEQRQNKVDAIVRMAAGEVLSLGSLAIGSDIVKGLWIGDAEKTGELKPLPNANLVITVPAETSGVVTVNANLAMTDNPSAYGLVKKGAGTAALHGDFAVSVTNEQGSMVFENPDAGCVGLNVSGVGARYAVNTYNEGEDVFGFTGKENAPLKATPTIFRTESMTRLAHFIVTDGSYARCIGAQFCDLEVSQSPEDHLSNLPRCLEIADGSTGVLSLEGSSYMGVLTIGGDGTGKSSRGALYLSDGASVLNYSATAADKIFGNMDCYSYVEISGGSTYTAAGSWIGGVDGQFGLVITNGTFTHTPNAVRASGFSIGGGDGQASVYVGKGGEFLATNIASSAVMIPGASSGDTGRQQMTVEDGGFFSIGTNRLMISGETVVNINEGGVFAAASVQCTDVAAVQFDGGTFRATANGTLFQAPAGAVFVQSKGATFDVPLGMMVSCGAPIAGVEGQGIASIALPDELKDLVLVGPPAVRISTTSGTRGSSAICIYDAATRHVTGVKVTGRGYGRTTDPTVYFHYADDKVVKGTAGTVERVDVTTGPVKKTGDGFLVFDRPNTYTSVTIVAGGTLSVTVPDALPRGGTIRLDGGRIDLNQLNVTCADLKGNGSKGQIENGSLTLESVKFDMDAILGGAAIDSCDFTNVQFAANATVKLENLDVSKLVRGQEYELFRFTGSTPRRMPPIDPEVYANGLSEAWGIAIKDDKAVLCYFGGSLFIYY